MQYLVLKSLHIGPNLAKESSYIPRQAHLFTKGIGLMRELTIMSITLPIGKHQPIIVATVDAENRNIEMQDHCRHAYNFKP
eukprot:5582703-Ditylum_brightwellii.AAC.1